jgi:hypothetical protein
LTVREHAGFWGDGDEIEAIELVEKRLEAKLRPEDAAKIWTVGELWYALLESNSSLEGNRRSWRRFVVALTAHTGINPREISEQTLLIEPGHQNIFKHLWKLVSRKNSNA